MSDAFSRIIAIIIVILMLFIFPSYYTAQKYDAICQNYLTNVTDEFAEDVRKQGKVTQQRYNSFVEDLDKTGLMYNVGMTYKHEGVMPKFNSGTGEVIGVETYEEVIYTDDILHSIYNEVTADGQPQGVFLMEEGGYFTVEVENREKTLFAKMSQMLLSKAQKAGQLHAVAGGSIRDENY